MSSPSSRLAARLSLAAATAVAALCTPQAFAQTTAASVVQNTLPIQVPTIEQLAQYPRMTGFRLSPDGKHLIAIESQGDVRSVLVWATDKLAEKPTVIGASNMRISGAAFLKNDMLAVTLWQPYDSRIGDLTKTFITKLLVTDLAGKTWKEPLESTGIARTEAEKRVRALAVPTVMSRMLGDPDHIVVESDDSGDERDLFRYNLRTGESSRLLRLGEDDITAMVDGRGEPYAKIRGGVDSRGAFIVTELRHPKSGEWEEHFRSYVKDRDLFDIVGRGLSPGTVVLRSNQGGREYTALYEYDVAARKIVGTLFEHRYFDASRLVMNGSADDPSTPDAFMGYAYDGLYGNEVHWADPGHEAVVKAVAQSLGIPTIAQTLMDVAADGKKAQVPMLDGVSVTIVDARQKPEPIYLIRVSGLAYPTEHYLLRGQRLSLLAKEHPQLDRRALGSARFVHYPARDGLNIPAILTVPNPALCGPGPYAAVIHPHGGPWSRDHMQYDNSGWVPLLVSRCRAVLQPQYRGSADLGRTLWVAGDAQWGQKMQDDKDDGAKWLVSQKLADPKRIAMFGFSYGGYAAFAAAVRPEGNYKCAIAGAGVSDIERIWAAYYTNPYFRERQAPTVKGLSPATVADKMQIPLMVYHGDRDQIVPLIQSELFVDKARKSDKPVEYHVLADYAHGPAWTREINARQLGLIDQYLAKGCAGGL